MEPMLSLKCQLESGDLADENISNHLVGHLSPVHLPQRKNKYLLILFVLYGVTFINYLLKAFSLSMSTLAVLVLKQIFQFCCVGDFLLNSFAMMPHRVYGLRFVINFEKMLFPGVCFVFMYFFVYVVVKNNDLWSDLFCL